MMDNNIRRFQNRNLMNIEPGMGDINVMVKPSSLKDKTPMCLVNELARYNRIQHQYNLTKEEGPPHKKKFTVALKLGDSEYEAQGTSIKKAQHEAAAIALRNTKYKHPPPKLLPNTRVNTTPTVELNALAMKRGEATVYTILSQPASSYIPPAYPLSYYGRNMYQTRTAYNEYGYNEYNFINRFSYTGSQYNNIRYKCSALYKISLKVGDREYIAEGSSAQVARHRAAKKALDDLRNLPIENKNGSVDAVDGVDGSSEDSKSPISAVHEAAFQHNMQAVFEVIEERGPPHLRIFVTQCRVGDFKTTGEGNGKKISKRRAAEQMVILMATLPPPPKPILPNGDKRRIKKRPTIIKKTTHAIDNSSAYQLIEDNKSFEVNPITRLMEYQKKKQSKEPVYILVDEKGWGRKKQFSIEVTIDNFKCIGTGPSKKDAKRKASEDMLELLGLSTIKNDIQVVKNEKEEIITQNNCTSPCVLNGKQLAPGLLLVPNVNLSMKQNIKKQYSPQKNNVKMTNGGSHYIEQYANMKQKLFSSIKLQKNVAKEQLIHLANAFGYEVKFSDFPKGHHHQEFLSLVTVNTSPPQTCYGSGESTKTAQNEAAYNALSMISEMGVENLFTKKIPAYISEKEIVS